MFVTRPDAYCASTQRLSAATSGSDFSTGRPVWCESQTASPAAPEFFDIITLGGLLRSLVVSKIFYISSSFSRPSAWMPACVTLKLRPTKGVLSGMR